jgi:3-methyladenine DNA glycosylase AlkD
MQAEKIISFLKSLSDREIAAHSQRYFKTGKGEYGEGDKFLGIRVPVLRKAVKQFQLTPLTEIKKCLRSEYHEARLFSLFLLVQQFSAADEVKREKIYRLYLANTKYINNWDLIDSSAPKIVGAWLFDKDRTILAELASSALLWERRIAIMATAFFIKNGQYKDTLKLSLMLLYDEEDLVQKAVGWMLREVGNKDRATEEKFLKKHYKNMPRTMLRYAIEKFSRQRRNEYLLGQV